MSAPAERRGAPRAAADFPLQISPRAGSRPARLQNISQSGLCCLFGEPLTEMTLLGIDLELPGGPARGIQGIVVRCEKQRGITPPTYEVAIYFTEMEPATRRALQLFVQDRLRQSTPR